MREGVERQKIGEVGPYRASKLLGARRIKSVSDLDVGSARAQELDDGKRLKTFTDRRRVKPDERAGRVTRSRPPLRVSLD